jgi:hypothetical protein
MISRDKSSYTASLFLEVVCMICAKNNKWTEGKSQNTECQNSCMQDRFMQQGLYSVAD